MPEALLPFLHRRACLDIRRAAATGPVRRPPPAQRQAPAAAPARESVPPPLRHRGRLCSGGTNNTQTCCAGSPGLHRPAVPSARARPAGPTERQGKGAGASSAVSSQVPHQPSRQPRGQGAGRGGAGGQPRRQAGSPPAPRSGQPPPYGEGRSTAPAPPPEEQSAARPQGLRCARGCRGAAPRRWARRRALLDAATHPALALPCPDREIAGCRAGGRGAEPGPSRSGRAAAAALSRLVPPRRPGGSPRGRGRLRPLPRRQGDSEPRALRAPPPPRCPRLSSPPPPTRAGRGAALRPAAAREPVRARDGDTKSHPAGRQCAAAAPHPQAGAPPGRRSCCPSLRSVTEGPL